MVVPFCAEPSCAQTHGDERSREIVRERLPIECLPDLLQFLAIVRFLADADERLVGFGGG
jgi:hypothetical protein